MVEIASPIWFARSKEEICGLAIFVSMLHVGQSLSVMQDLP
jgi:hypothetical protein